MVPGETMQGSGVFILASSLHLTTYLNIVEVYRLFECEAFSKSFIKKKKKTLSMFLNHVYVGYNSLVVGDPLTIFGLLDCKVKM